MCDQVSVVAHDLHFVDLVAVERLENDTCARGQVLDDDLLKIE